MARKIRGGVGWSLGGEGHYEVLRIKGRVAMINTIHIGEGLVKM